MNAAWRRRALLGGLAVTVILSILPDDGADVVPAEAAGPSPATSKRLGPEPSAEAGGGLDLERLHRDDPAAGEVGNAFGPTSWYVPPPPPPPVKPLPPPPPPPPSPPPLPFSYLGRYQEGDTLILLLTKGDRIYTVSVGTVIDNTYRVERWDSGLLELTYLPLGMKQTLATG